MHPTMESVAQSTLFHKSEKSKFRCEDKKEQQRITLREDDKRIKNDMT